MTAKRRHWKYRPALNVPDRTFASNIALELSLTGERLSAQKAEHWGLIHACIEQQSLPAAALEMALQLTRLPAHGVIEARSVFEEVGHNDLRAQLTYEADRQSELLNLKTLEEGVTSFFENASRTFPNAN